MTERDPRRDAILSAAVTVFARFGYRRASMDEVARAAQLSRQGLYFHFANKEVLFAETVGYLLETSLEGARAALASEGSLEERIISAYDAMYGPHLGGGMLGSSPHLGELFEAARQALGDRVKAHERAFASVIGQALREGGAIEVAEASGVTSKELMLALDAVATGLKHAAASREIFVQQLRLAVHAVLRMPRAEAPKKKRKR